MSTSNPYLFQQAQTATLGDEEIRIAFGKIGTPTINMTVADFLTWINNRNQWIYPTLLNGWANFSGNPSLPPIRYRKNLLGQLEIHGAADCSYATSSIMFVLQEGYIPVDTVACFVVDPGNSGTKTFYEGVINASGEANGNVEVLGYADILSDIRISAVIPF